MLIFLHNSATTQVSHVTYDAAKILLQRSSTYQSFLKKNRILISNCLLAVKFANSVKQVPLASESSSGRFPGERLFVPFVK